MLSVYQVSQILRAIWSDLDSIALKSTLTVFPMDLMYSLSFIFLYILLVSLRFSLGMNDYKKKSTKVFNNDHKLSFQGKQTLA